MIFIPQRLDDGAISCGGVDVLKMKLLKKPIRLKSMERILVKHLIKYYMTVLEESLKLLNTVDDDNGSFCEGWLLKYRWSWSSFERRKELK